MLTGNHKQGYKKDAASQALRHLSYSRRQSSLRCTPQALCCTKADKRVAEKYTEEKVQIIDKDNRVHMAHIDIHYGFSVNGVAAIHTEILKDTELNHFYKSADACTHEVS